MKVKVFLPHSFKVDYNADFTVGVDYGAFILAKKEIEMDVAIGDFDSTSIEEKELIKKWSKKVINLKVEKDETDSEAAIMYLQDLGFSDITLIGDVGNRLDHFLINFKLCEKYDVAYILEEAKVFNLKKGQHKIKNTHQVFSLFVSDFCRLSVSGVKYRIDNLKVNYFDTFLSSNQIIEDFAFVNIFEGSVTVVLSNDK